MHGGGGGRTLPAKLGIEDTTLPCHPELADLRTAERRESRIASRLSRLEQSSLGETLRAWSKSKTDSGSVQCCILPVTLARSRNHLARLAKNGTAKSVVFALCLRSLAQFGMTPTESVLCLVNRLSVKKCAFTMAEILLSLTIIGVVAAITLPSLTGNINERTWNTQRKALYARFSQAIALMPALNGYGTLKEESSSGASDAVDTAAETFVTNGLSKVMKINNICDNEHLEDCGLSSKLTTLGGIQIDLPTTLQELNSSMTGTITAPYGGNAYIIDSKAAAFETQNGESIIVYYNPTCNGSLAEKAFSDTSNSGGYKMQSKVCANFIYDLNGSKGPNTVGKDIGFMTALYPFDAQIYAPYPSVKPQSTGNHNKSDAIKMCTSYDSEYRLPNLGEAVSMFVNGKLINASDYTSSLGFATSEIFTPSAFFEEVHDIMTVQFTSGVIEDRAQGSVWCIRR